MRMRVCLTLGIPLTPVIAVYKLSTPATHLNMLNLIQLITAHDLNTAIFAKINAACKMGEIFVIDYDDKTNSIGVKLKNNIPGITFKIYTDSELTDPTNKKLEREQPI